MFSLIFEAVVATALDIFGSDLCCANDVAFGDEVCLAVRLVALSWPYRALSKVVNDWQHMRVSTAFCHMLACSRGRLSHVCMRSCADDLAIVVQAASVRMDFAEDAKLKGNDMYRSPIFYVNEAVQCVFCFR